MEKIRIDLVRLKTEEDALKRSIYKADGDARECKNNK